MNVTVTFRGGNVQESFEDITAIQTAPDATLYLFPDKGRWYHWAPHEWESFTVDQGD